MRIREKKLMKHECKWLGQRTIFFCKNSEISVQRYVLCEDGHSMKVNEFSFPGTQVSCDISISQLKTVSMHVYLVNAFSTTYLFYILNYIIHTITILCLLIRKMK